ncbi:glycosyltransferase family 4 protein [Paenibacillus methanolicus]|uniref:Glycosyltransferase involved in cell wall biosynthesis n=1 Tax=Paenibacillus methanolicus TaxID=582686 RepID=A0A5S5BQ59_9BACL|nr:glycosyltransferase family 4 protein [Paenibacillus methanolicus]TYP69127.1 glycosyltransferase involved in cell wall biosynthesis [Paenibacillus methanolicus]
MEKILIVTSDLSVKGGVSSAVHSLMQEINSRKKSDIKLYSSYITTHPVLSILYSLMRIAAFFLLLYPFRYRLFYVHVCAFGSFYRKAIYVLALRMLNRPVVIHQHAADLDVFVNKNRFNKWLARKVYEASSSIFVLSENMKAITKSVAAVEEIHIIKNPVQVPAHNKDYSTADQKIRLLFLGEVGQRKGIFDLIQAVADMTEEQRDRIQLDIGGNKELDKLREMIKANRLEETCIVHGWVTGEQKNQLLKEASVFLLPSYFEGVPIAILEAMSYGLPVISTNIAGIPEVVKHRYNGHIIEPGDIQALRSSIVYFLEHSENLQVFGENSRKIVEEHDVRLIANHILSLFGRITSGSEGLSIENSLHGKR